MRVLSLFIFLLFFTSSKGQFISIPDPNFKSYLESEFPSCMSGGMLDTTCSLIVDADKLILVNLDISDLTGVQYFDNLTGLYCNQNHLTSLPPLPHSLITLRCDSNSLASLPALPVTLIELHCSFNELTNLPSLPPTLDFLYSPHNHLTSLPTLPASLTNLDLDDNQLTSLPTLPSLTALYCGFNQLTSLPTLPSSLNTLYCTSNQLTSLPTLPSSLTELYCSTNQLTSLPDLPSSLTSLFCARNQLTCLPILPDGLINLYATTNNIVCLPNVPSNPNFFSTIGTDVCNISNNTNGCLILSSSNKIVDEDVLKIFPNPSTGMISLSGNINNQATIKVLGVDGKLICAFDEVDLNKIFNLDLSSEGKGFYFVQIVVGQKVITKKVVVN